MTKTNLDTSHQGTIEVPCAGGLILDRNIFTMPYGAALELENMEVNIDGGYSRIKGYSEYSATALSGSGQVLGITTLGSDVIACRGANVEKGTGGTWTSIVSNRTSAGRYSFDKYNWDGTERIIMADGQNYAATYDGSTYTLMNGSAGAGSGTAPSAPVWVQEFRGHMFYVQDNEITFSAPFDSNDFTAGNGAGSLKVADDVLGLKRQRDELFVFCENSIYKLTGSALSDFAVEPVTLRVGCKCPHTIQELGGDLVFLSHDGLRTIARTARIGDIEIGSISKAVQSRLNTLSSSCTYSSALIRNKSQYRIFFPTSDTAQSNAKGLIGVLNRPLTPKTSGDAHELDFDAGWEFSDIRGIKPSYVCNDILGTEDVVLHGDFTNGKIYKQEDTTQFDGSNIDWIFRSSNMPLDDSAIRKVLHRLNLYFASQGTLNATLDIIYNNLDTNTPQPNSWTLTNTQGSVYGTAKYGTGIYSVVTTVFIRQAVEGSGWTVGVKLSSSSNSSDFTLKGFALEYTLTGRR